MYLINLSFGLAGMERRIANIWHELRRRGNVRPTMVVPESLAGILAEAGLAELGDPLLCSVPEPSFVRGLNRARLPAWAGTLKAFLRSRFVARNYRPIWRRIENDVNAVGHFGLNCSALVPPHIPFVYECVDSTLSQLGTRHYARAAARRCIVHCQTERIRAELERVNAHRRPLWETVTSPCYFARYPDDVHPDKKIRPMLIAFSGRFAPEKNPLLLLDAVARVRERGHDCRVIMLGEGPLSGDMRRRISELRLASAVDIDFVKKPLERIQDAAVFVSLQTGDNYGSQSLLEAMGAGCAVMATAVGETHRLVTPDVGLLAKPDVEHVSEALISLLLNPEGTLNMGRAASSRARTLFSADTYVDFLESLYERACELHRRSREGKI